MSSSSNIYSMLNVSAITTLLGKYKTKAAIFDSPIIPQDMKGKTINFYAVSPLNGRLEYTELRYTINCRAETYPSASQIADKVFQTLNRKGADLICYCSRLPIIPPQDDRDNFNCPVEVLIKQRGI